MHGLRTSNAGGLSYGSNLSLYRFVPPFFSFSLSLSINKLIIIYHETSEGHLGSGIAVDVQYQVSFGLLLGTGRKSHDINECTKYTNVSLYKKLPLYKSRV